MLLDYTNYTLVIEMTPYFSDTNKGTYLVYSSEETRFTLGSVDTFVSTVLSHTSLVDSGVK